MNEDNKEKAMDPLTGEEFVPKRSNQKFASRENQIRYNNLKAKEIRQAKSKTRKISFKKNLLNFFIKENLNY